MCMNCGCKLYKDDMGNSKNLTLKDFAEAAIASNMSAEDTLANIKEALEEITPEMLQEEIDKLKAKS